MKFASNCFLEYHYVVLGKQNVQAKQVYSLSLVKQELKLRSLRQREHRILTEKQRKVTL